MGTTSESDVPPSKLKHALEILDDEPLLSADLLYLAQWAADYYHHPIGEVLSSVLPPPLRRGRAAEQKGRTTWHLTPEGRSINATDLTRAPRQAMLLAMLQQHPDGLTADQLTDSEGDWRPILKSLVKKGWIQQKTEAPRGGHVDTDHSGETPPVLNDAQQRAVEHIVNASTQFCPILLEGVTGSGKTEVYLKAIEHIIESGRQALVLAPEIGLTPQLVARFRERFAVPIAVTHSGLSDGDRLSAWLTARSGESAILIGTRSAVLTPLKNPGLIIVDEEHDLSFKQQEGFRYSARDLAVLRAKYANIPIVLGSATPSLESLLNVESKRYQHLRLPQRAGRATSPTIHILDIRGQRMRECLSAALIAEIQKHLSAGGQALLFLNRRGYAPTLMCHDCGWVAECRRCDAHMTLHHGERQLRCHHCGAQRPAEKSCPTCSSENLIPVGRGTERLNELLAERFPGVGIVRVDRDTTRRKGAMESMLETVHRGESRILVGTQMLAKGHHFPNITLVGIVDVDYGLFSADFRATERMGQLILQVAGRAGRADHPGEVFLQTHHPEHPLLHLLISQGYGAFAEATLAERYQAQLPPYTHIALLRAEATTAELPPAFLENAKALAIDIGAIGVALMGPVPAPMPKRAGRYRGQLLLLSPQRGSLQRLLSSWTKQLSTLKLARKVRWSIDVDALELF